MQEEVKVVAICKNCGGPVNSAYCRHCGEKANTERITGAYLWNEFFRFFTHLEKGFLFTSWKMLVSPGPSVKKFIEGNRMPYQKPVSYFVIWTGVYLLQLYFIEKLFGENVIVNRSHYFGNISVTEFATHYLTPTLGVLLPFYALYLQVTCMGKYFNFFESFTAVLYAQGTVLLLQVVFTFTAMLWFLLTRQSVDADISDVVKFIYVTWLGYDLVRLVPLKHKWLRAILYSTLTMTLFVLWRMYGFPFVAGLVNGQ